MKLLLFNFKSFITSKNQALEIIKVLTPVPKDLICILAVPYSLISFMRDKVRGNPSLHIASQDISPFGAGAYTGLENGEMIADLGARYTLIGHHETCKALALLNEDIQSKIEQANKSSLTPIVYLNNSFEESDEEKNIDISIKTINAVGAESLVLVFDTKENTTSSETIKSVYKKLRKELSVRNFYFLYGGNLDEKRIQELKQLKFIDGFAIGYNALINKERKNIYEQFSN